MLHGTNAGLSMHTTTAAQQALLGVAVVAFSFALTACGGSPSSRSFSSGGGTSQDSGTGTTAATTPPTSNQAPPSLGGEDAGLGTPSGNGPLGSPDAGPTSASCGDAGDQTGCSCTANTTQQCYGGDPTQAGVGVCNYGMQQCVPSTTGGELMEYVWGPCTGWGSPQPEMCNGMDDLCDGMIDEGCSCMDGAQQPCTTSCGTGTQTCSGGVFGACSLVCPTAAVCAASGVQEDFTAVCRNWDGSKTQEVDDCYVTHQCAAGCVADVVNLSQSIQDAQGELSNCTYTVTGDATTGQSIRVDCTYNNINGVNTNAIDFACTAPP